jgi:GNAT superfamily N-acetyltransferase
VSLAKEVMSVTTRVERRVALRPAVPGDVEAICRTWCRGWRDGHLGHVPEALVRQRRLADFRELVPPRLDATTVATIGSRVVGFVTLHDHEVEQLYVAAAVRGTGVADALLAHGEAAIGTSYDRAWLAVVAGNVRARRFYERNGWSEAGPFDNPAPTPRGDTIPVPALRYEKPLEPSAASRPVAHDAVGSEGTGFRRHRVPPA